MFTSDHGHMLDQDTDDAGGEPQCSMARTESGVLSRRNCPQGQANQGCQRLDEVVLAWNSKLRYASKRNGYHGGCAPAEALVPFATYRYGTKAGDEWSIRDEAHPIGGRRDGTRFRDQGIEEHGPHRKPQIQHRGSVQGVLLHRPDYQREYVWTDKEVHQLLEDIGEQIDAGTTREYFIGTVLVSPTDQKNHYEVIDGQQRLTTFFLLLVRLSIYSRESRSGR
jgi:hypothetical protein